MIRVNRVLKVMIGVILATSDAIRQTAEQDSPSERPHISRLREGASRTSSPKTSVHLSFEPPHQELAKTKGKGSKHIFIQKSKNKYDKVNGLENGTKKADKDKDGSSKEKGSKKDSKKGSKSSKGKKGIHDILSPTGAPSSRLSNPPDKTYASLSDIPSRKSFVPSVPPSVKRTPDESLIPSFIASPGPSFLPTSEIQASVQPSQIVNNNLPFKAPNSRDVLSRAPNGNDVPSKMPITPNRPMPISRSERPSNTPFTVEPTKSRRPSPPPTPQPSQSPNDNSSPTQSPSVTPSGMPNTTTLPPTVELESSSQSPSLANSTNGTVDVTPFGIQYTLNSKDVPGSTDYNDVALLTDQYLNKHFSAYFEQTIFTKLNDFLTVLTSADFVFERPIQMNFEARAFFSSESTILPNMDDLDTVLNEAFVGTNLDAYIVALRNLSANNIFSTTLMVMMTNSSSVLPSNDQRESIQQKASAAIVDETTKNAAKRGKLILSAVFLTVGSSVGLAAFAYHLSRKRRHLQFPFKPLNDPIGFTMSESSVTMTDDDSHEIPMRSIFYLEQKTLSSETSFSWDNDANPTPISSLSFVSQPVGKDLLQFEGKKTRICKTGAFEDVPL